MIGIGQGGRDPATDVDVSDQPQVLEAICRYVRPERIAGVLTQTGRASRRIRKVPATAVVWLVIAMGLWGDLNLGSLWRQIAGTLRSLLAALGEQWPPSKSALSQARSRLGARPLRRLLVELSAPIARSNTPGAFYKQMRLMVIDGQKMLIPDTPANRQAFGKQLTKRFGKTMESGYPQVHTIRLIEAGTHLTVELLIKPAKNNEYPSAAALLDKVGPGDLVLWDRGFYGYSLLKRAVDQAKHVLGRVPAHVVFEGVRDLSDGSYLACIYPTLKDQRHHTNGLIVRVIQYTIQDKNRPGHGQLHRLITTLLDEKLHPSVELIVLYHQRWEVEIANDEIVTHQLARAVELRSRTPIGVVQELYGIHLAHNAVRAMMHESALWAELDPRELSFIHAVRVIREMVPLMRAARTEQLPMLYAGMIRQIAQGQLPPRDGRINPRAVKIKMSNYTKKRPEHRHWPQPNTTFLAAIKMLK